MGSRDEMEPLRERDGNDQAHRGMDVENYPLKTASSNLLWLSLGGEQTAGPGDESDRFQTTEGLDMVPRSF